MSKKELEDMIQDRIDDLEHIKKKLESDRILEDEKEFGRHWNRRIELEKEIEQLKIKLATY